MYNYNMIPSNEKVLIYRAKRNFANAIAKPGLDEFFKEWTAYPSSYIKDNNVKTVDGFIEYLERNLGIRLTTKLTERDFKFAVGVAIRKFSTYSIVSHKLYAMYKPEYANTPFADIPEYDRNKYEPTEMKAEEFRVLMNTLHMSNTNLDCDHGIKFVLLARKIWTPSILELTTKILYRNELHLNTETLSIAYSIVILRNIFKMNDSEIYASCQFEYIHNVVRSKMSLSKSSVANYSYLSMTRVVFKFLGFNFDDVKTIHAHLSKMNKISLLIVDYPKNKPALQAVFNAPNSSSGEIDKILAGYSIKK